MIGRLPFLVLFGRFTTTLAIQIPLGGGKPNKYPRNPRFFRKSRNWNRCVCHVRDVHGPECPGLWRRSVSSFEG